jgi:hypothetical protein
MGCCGGYAVILPPVRSAGQPRQSREGEGEGFHARIEKLDLEQPIGDRRRLPDQLILPLFGHRTITLLVDVNPISGARACSTGAKSPGVAGSAALKLAAGPV